MLKSKELSFLLAEITILYVEDEIETQNIIYDTLKVFSNRVLTASNGEEALEICKKNDVQLIITDINMPIVDGITFLKKIREKSIMSPAIIVLTAYTQNDYLISCANLNIQAYITKPINFKNLKNALFKAVEYLNSSLNLYIRIGKQISYDRINGVILGKNNIKLNKKEKSLMNLLIESRNKLVTYEEIDKTVWQEYDEVMTPSALRTLVKNLRKKLVYNVIENISGLGYKIAN